MNSHDGSSRRVLRQHTMVVGCLFVGVAVFSGPAKSQPPLPTMAEIEAKWRAREDKTPSFRVSWEARRTLPKGVFDIVVQLSGEPGKTGPAPRTDTIVDEKGALLVSGKKFRLDLDTTTWSVKEETIRPTSITHVSDGVAYTHYLRKSEVFEYGTAHQKKLDTKGAAPILQPQVLVPVVLAFRGRDSYFAGRPLGEFHVKRRVPVSGRDCVELVYESRSQNLTETLLLDTQRDYIPLRAATQSGNMVVSQVDITYVPVPEFGWVPQSWECVLRSSPTAIRESCKVHKTTVEILADPASGEEFQVALDPGSRVIDRTGEKVKHSVVRPDGSAGSSVAVGDGGRAPLYEDLVAKNDAQAQVNWYVWTAIGSVAVLVVLLTYRCWPRSSKPPVPAP